MRSAHTVEQVRAAEAALMARLPEGALMQRAAAGLAYAVLDLLGRGVRRAGCCCWSASGDNGGDALYAGALLARRGVARRGAAARPDQAHAAGLAALRARRRPGGRRRSTAPRARRRGRRDRRDRRPRRAARRRGGARSRRCAGVPVVAVDVPVGRRRGHRRGRRARTSRPTVTVTFGTHKVAHLVDPAAMACGVVHLVDIGLDLPAPAVDGAAGRRRRARCCRGPAPDAHKYTRGVVGVRAGSEQLPRRRRALRRRREHRAGRHGPLRRRRPPTWSAPRTPRWSSARAGCRPGWSAPAAATDAGQALADALADGVPVVVDADGLAHVDRPARRPGAAHPARRRAGPDARRRARARSRPSSCASPARRPSGTTRWCCSRAGTRWSPRPTAGCGSPPAGRRGWRPPAPATCSPGCSARCWPPGSTRSTPARSAPGCTARPRVAGRAAAGRVTARDVARRRRPRCCARWPCGLTARSTGPDERQP